MAGPGTRGAGPDGFPDRAIPLSPPDPAELEQAIGSLGPLIEMVAGSEVSLTSVTDPERAEKVHLRDSLSALALEEVRSARAAVDIGSGAGFPGLPLAQALPGTKFTLIDSVGKKARFVSRAASRLGLGNVEAIATRSEELAAGAGRESYDLALARAVGPLSVLAELASPLLEEGGTLVAWKGERELEEEAKVGALADRLAMAPAGVFTVSPFEGSRGHHLYLLTKSGPTPDSLPRRPGMARKRPLSE